MRGAGTRFATWFYVLHLLLHQSKALLVTVHSPYFATLANNAKTALAVQDVESDQFWKADFFYWELCFPHWGRLDIVKQTNQPWRRFSTFVTRLRILCWDLTVSWAITHYFVFFEEEFTGGVDKELEEVLCCTKDDLNENEVLNLSDNEWYLLFILIAFILYCITFSTFSGNSDDRDEEEGFTLGSHVIALWEKKRARIWYMTMQLLDGPFLCNLKSALTALICSQDLIICKLSKLWWNSTQSPVPIWIWLMNLLKIVLIFSIEVKNFQATIVPFDHPGWFSTKDAMAGRSHIWHEMYSLPYTWLLGFFACRVTSMRLGIGACERSWKDVKMINNRKRSNLSGDSLEKQAILFTSAHLEDARICSEHKCSNDFSNNLQMKIFSKIHFIIKLILWTFLVFLQFCRFVLQDIEVMRVIGWTEDWEIELKRKNCPVVEASFLIKYKNLFF